jgi:hypothetical protein
VHSGSRILLILLLLLVVLLLILRRGYLILCLRWRIVVCDGLLTRKRLHIVLVLLVLRISRLRLDVGSVRCG